MKTIEFNKREEVFSSLNFVEKNNQYICDCPSCNVHEAYVYKDSLNDDVLFIHCPRQNNCGDTTSVFFKEKEIHFEATASHDKNNKINKEEQETLKKLTQYLKTLVDNFPATNYLEKRGVDPKKVNNMFEFDLAKHDLIQIFTTLASSVNNKKIKENLMKMVQQPYFNKRNVISFISDEKGMLDSLILRSSDQSINPKYKEITAPISSVRHRDFWCNISDNKRIIFVTEGLMDTLSIKSVADNEVNYIALKGVNSQYKLKKYIEENKKSLSQQKFIICFDNDRAGENGTEKVIKTLKENSIEYAVFLNEHTKDMNDYLLHDKQKFKEKINSLEENNMTNEMLNETVDATIESSKSKNICLTYLGNEIDREKTKFYSAQVKLGDMYVSGHVTYFKDTENYLFSAPQVKGKDDKWYKTVQMDKVLNQKINEGFKEVIENGNTGKLNHVLKSNDKELSLLENWQTPFVKINHQFENGTLSGSVSLNGVNINNVTFPKYEDRYFVSFPNTKYVDKEGVEQYSNIIASPKELNNKILESYEKAKTTFYNKKKEKDLER